jgi:2-hydroxy-6-oxonona-2,4-dienedioate hydrolase
MPRRGGLYRRGWWSTWSRVHGLRLHARRTFTPVGTKPVVLVHGLLVSSRYMAPLARSLSRYADVWAPDMPGFGRSENPSRVLDVDGLARALNAWLDATDLNDVVLAANSFGCQYAARAVARDPSRIAGLVLLGPTFEPGQRDPVGPALRWLANAPFEPPSLGVVVLRDLLDAGMWRAVATYRHALAHAIEEDLARVARPVLVVRGGRDPLIVQEWADRCAAIAGAGRAVSVPRAAHTINYNSAAAVAALIRPLLDRPGEGFDEGASRVRAEA